MCMVLGKDIDNDINVQNFTGNTQQKIKKKQKTKKKQPTNKRDRGESIILSSNLVKCLLHRVFI